MKSMNKEEIVISGISGRYPESDTIDEFSDNLYKSRNMITDDDRRFPKEFNECPMSSGKLKHADKLDAQFFGVTDWEADYMDAQIRVMLETTYEAIWDSGTVPELLSGTNTGVFIGQYMDEELIAYRDYTQLAAYKNFMSQTIAYKFNLIGPTFSADSACASSLVALNEAFMAIRNDRCDNAIVVGVNISFNPGIQYNFFKLNMISPDSKCMCLDASANGYAKGEACVTVLLQKKSCAKRIYATIINVKSNNDGYKEEGITFPSWQRQSTVIASTYAECNTDPKLIDYVEAHCTGTKAGDPVEMRAIYQSMIEGRRDKPLLIGALKSNIGHTEGASGVCALTKVILAFENELIPANLHFKKPNPNIESLINGYIKPINKNTTFTGDIVGLNNFGFGGSNAHLILKSPKIKPMNDNNIIVGKYHRLVQMCGRNEKSVKYFFDKLFERPEKITRDLLHLINELSKTNAFKTNTGYQPMRYRGFTLINQKSGQKVVIKYSKIQIKKVSKNRKPICFLYPGIGSQWLAMAKQLIHFDIISKSIQNSCLILRDKGIDLLKLLTEINSDMNSSPINSMVSLVAIQIALTDLLKQLDVIPDQIIGYSTGEVVCAYADECIGAEEALLIAYYCGKFIERLIEKKGLNPKIKELGKEDLNQLLDKYYEEVLNSSDTEYNIDLLLNQLNSILKNNVIKTTKWISNKSSVPDLKNIFGRYFVNSLLFPVSFRNILDSIPENAIIVEVSPDSLLETEINNSVQNYTYVSLMKRNSNNSKQLLKGFGKLYTEGLNVKIEKLYAPVNEPVCTGTRILSPWIKWNHIKSYRLTKYPDFFNFLNSKEDESYIIDFMDPNDLFIKDHCIDGKILVPATAYLLFAWKTLAFHKKVPYRDFAVEFRDIQILRATPIQTNGKVKLYTNFDPSTGRFDIIDSGTVVVSGSVFEITSKELQFKNVFNEIKSIDEKNRRNNKNSEPIVLKTKDIYKILRLRGYMYGKQFQCISQAYEICDKYMSANIDWNNNWVTFTDCVLQTSILGQQTKKLLVPVAIELLRCDPNLIFNNSTQNKEQRKEFAVIFDPDLNIAVTDGLEVRGIKASHLQRNINSQKPALRAYKFEAFNGHFKYENENTFLKYKTICDELALKIINNETGVSLSGTESQSFNLISEEMRIIYKLLLDLSENRIKFNDNIKDIDKDLMNGYISDKNFLRSQLTVVLENRNELNNDDFKILEINESSVPMYSSVMNALDVLQYSLNISYTLIHSNSMPTELMNSLNVKKYIFNNSCIGPEINEIDLIVYKDQSLCHLSSESNSDLNTLFTSFWQKLKSNAFLLIQMKDELSISEKLIFNSFQLKTYDLRKEFIKSLAKKLGFHLIGDKSDCFSIHSLLFRKITFECIVEKQIFIRFTNEYKEWFEKLVTELKLIDDKPEDQNIWLIGNCPIDGLLGFVKSLRKEPKGNRIRCLSIIESNDISDKNSELREIVKKDLAINVVKDNKYGNYVLKELPAHKHKALTEHCFINLINRGDLSSFEWFENQHKYWPIDRKLNQKLIHVYYSALNFKDVMVATGRLNVEPPSGDTECMIGLEFSGRDENMNRVMGMNTSRALATTCLAGDSDFLWPIPDHWSMEEAVTIPCVYATAYYGLIIRGKLKPNEKVLIHSGSGGVGQAAIRICLSLNCQLFITVGSDSKRDFLKKLFPVLKDINFSSSRDLSFKTCVLKQTNGSGVDVVLNSLSDEKLFASLECLANNGRFLEIGKYDLFKDSTLNLSDLLKNKTFQSIQVDTLFVFKDKTSKVMLRERNRIWDLISDGIKKGVVVPLNCNVYDYDKCEEAFRFMASGRHMGKVVLKIRGEENMNKNFSFKPMKLLAIPRTVFYPNKSYVITGGLGGMGLELIDWMIERGAKKFIITSRSGPKQPYQYSRLNYFRKLGIETTIWTQEINSTNGTKNLLTEALKLGSIGGIFHLSMILSDSLLENQTIESFDKVFEPKSKPLLNLDYISRQMCPNLDYFVVFSSAVTSHGNAGQTNYGLTNAVMERVCELRRKEGFPALAVQWGLVGDVGYVTENISTEDSVLFGSIRSQRMYSCLQTLDKLLQMDVTICSSVMFNEQNRKTESFSDKRGLLKKVAHILGHKEFDTKFEAKTRLSELGMDSLMSVEIKQTIERDFDLVLSTQEVQNLTIARIRQIESRSETLVKSMTKVKEQKSRADTAVKEPIFQIPKERVIHLNDLRDGKKIFYLPPTDGTYDLFRPVAQLLDRPVIGLNWTEDCLKLASIRETAHHFLNIIFKSYPESEFDLIGYSYGVFIALEMSLILQKEYNRNPKLIALDMCPIQAKHDLKLSMDSTKDIFGGEEELNLMFSFLMDKISIESKELAKMLANVPKTQRIEKVSKFFLEKSQLKCGLKEVMFALESHVNKVWQTFKYPIDSINKFNGNVLLLRANEHLLRSETRKDHFIAHDYGFNQIISGECKVVVLDGNHTMFLSNNSQTIAQNIHSYFKSN